jgi:hypothetical protein
VSSYSLAYTISVEYSLQVRPVFATVEGIEDDRGHTSSLEPSWMSKGKLYEYINQLIEPHQISPADSKTDSVGEFITTSQIVLRGLPWILALSLLTYLLSLIKGMSTLKKSVTILLDKTCMFM